MKIKQLDRTVCGVLRYSQHRTPHIKIICLTADLESRPPSQKYRVIKRDNLSVTALFINGKEQRLYMKE